MPTRSHGLGDSVDEIRRRMTAELRKSVREDARCRSERIAYLGPDGQVERDQIVVSLGRGIVFCHVYSYDENLFVAWDAHVNFGEWAESQVASGYIKRLRRYADIRTVVPGFHTITEYDLIDVNYLAEWAHSVMTKVLRRIMEERQIDQEIDFTIQRGERRSLIGVQQERSQSRRKRAIWRRAN